MDYNLPDNEVVKVLGAQYRVNSYRLKSYRVSRWAPVISKRLVSGNPEDRKNVRGMIVEVGNEPVMEMPVQVMHASKGQEQKGIFVDKKASNRPRVLQWP